MKRIAKIIGVIILIILVGGTIAWFGFLKPEPPPISQEDRAAIALMPLPSELNLGKGKFLMDADFDIQFLGMETSRLQRAVHRFSTRLQKRTGISFSSEKNGTLALNCQNKSDAYPNVQEDESYTISVERNKIDVSALMELGILRGLETLLQLVRQEEGKWYFPELEINDHPRYPWRGLMIDVSRHWIPKEVVLRNLDAMSAVKMNVLHLHLTDHQGFRMESKSFPKLHEMGSNGNYYTQEDMKEIIRYAAERGIRVVPEFDLPGHSAPWFVGYPELASGPGPHELETNFGGEAIVDPTQESTYEFLDVFFGEMATLFPDAYMHIGGMRLRQRNGMKMPRFRNS